MNDDVHAGEGCAFRKEAVFRCREIENRFRNWQQAHDSHATRLVVAIAGVGVLLFSYADYRILGTGTHFLPIVLLRLALAGHSVLLIKSLRSQVPPGVFDCRVTVWICVMAVAQAYVGSTRPADYAGHFIVHLFTILLTYTVIPLPLLLQAVPALIMSFGVVLSLVMKPPSMGITATAVVWALGGANMLGAAVSRQMHLFRRKQFLAIEREVRLRTELSTTLAELKVLRGVLPICANCKDIRNDVGAWQQLENYICSHSEATFSHGICPKCVAELYPMLD